MLGDMGAEVIKLERPKVGDDTRNFAPPFMPKNTAGEPSDVSAYFAGINRNKASVTMNYSKPEGQAVMKRLLSKSDIFVENFKTGTLEKYGLGYHQIKEEFPGLIYCSITGFGHTGPYSPRPGYDALIQAMGGIMSITGEPDGAPMKVGLSICDLTAGMHGAIGILAALRHKMVTGEGQHVDIGMLDVTTALLANQGMNYLATGKQPARLGNAHPNIVPYQVMPASDGFFILSVGNDATFERFIAVAQQADPDANAGDLLQDERFNCAVGRVTNREHVTATCNALTKSKPIAWWLENLEKASVGVSPIMDLEQVFADPHVQARGMVMEMEHKSLEQPAKLIASPLKFDKTPVSYRTPPPLLGEHSEEVLTSVGGYTDKEVAELREAGAI
jgi:crotonobetainyl-CoA:carnitine CoA-transferase CaiB-like acyl-CoA transferase